MLKFVVFKRYQKNYNIRCAYCDDGEDGDGEDGDDMYIFIREEGGYEQEKKKKQRNKRMTKSLIV